MTTIDPLDPERIRQRLLTAKNSQFDLSLLMVSHPDGDPQLYDMPISQALADELAAQCRETLATAADAELHPADPAFSPSPQQWLTSPIDPAGPIGVIEKLIERPTHELYSPDAPVSRRTLLVLRLRAPEGTELARLYQAFSPEKALQRSKFLLLWQGDHFTRLTDEPLVIDRALRLVSVDGAVVMRTSTAYQQIFGTPPELRAQAEKAYAASFGTLPIAGGDRLAAACRTDPNMMRKLVSIQAKLEQPGYAAALTMPNLVAFVRANQIAVQIEDPDGPTPRLVFDSGPQRRWDLLKLLDDDFLRSDLTQLRYEANSKTQL